MHICVDLFWNLLKVRCVIYTTSITRRYQPINVVFKQVCWTCLLQSTIVWSNRHTTSSSHLFVHWLSEALKKHFNSVWDNRFTKVIILSKNILVCVVSYPELKQIHTDLKVCICLVYKCGSLDVGFLLAYCLKHFLNIKHEFFLSLPRRLRRNPTTREHVKGKETHMITRVSWFEHHCCHGDLYLFLSTYSWKWLMLWCLLPSIHID